jgi:SNF2 family DNA or RNA helicase
MSSERLEWLELSTPPAPDGKKPADTGQPACPTCGWPVAPKVETCTHCGHSLTDKLTLNLLAELNVALLPHEIEMVSAPDHWFKDSTFDAPALYQLRLQAEQFRVTTGFDRLICLDDISVDHYQHQLEAALRALRDMRGRVLLADEVGLGKTIEAGIVMKELIERGLANTILILTPASLTWQWQEEMQTKFHETFTVLEELEQLPDASPEMPCRWLISLDRAKLSRWSEHLLAREYDLLIIDEAHKLKNHRTDAYRFVNSLRKRYVLMLTATPVHNDLMELYNLLSILRPGHLGTRRAFRQNFIESKPVKTTTPAKRQATRRTIYSSFNTTPDNYLGKSRELREAYRQDQVRSGWILKRVVRSVELGMLPNLDRAGQKAISEINELLGHGYEIEDFEAVEYEKPGLIRKQRRSDFVCRLKLKPQPGQHRKEERESQPKRRTTPRNPAALRQLLREVMIRNRRSSVGVRFPPRQAAVYALNLTPPERKLYNALTTYIRAQLQQQLQTTPGQSTGPLRMTLLTLQKQICSSPQATARALQNMVDQQSNPQLAEALILAWGIAQGRKTAATLELLDQYPGKFLIFTDYLPTLHALQAILNEAGHETVVFHGGLSPMERVEAVRAFRQKPSVRVMISTQSGSEGHNLQFCHQMINYDLPWNPMRIEQRVGRLHRLGQPETVTIFNLAANDTIEAYILDLLAHKIRMFELVIGELDLILGELSEQRSFEDYIEQVWAESRSEAELLQMIANLNKVLEGARKTYEEVRSTSDELSDWLEAYDEVKGLG